MAGLVPGSMWNFSPGSTADHKGDYHKAFNGDNYLQWWTNQQPSIFTLDNTKYHLAHIPRWNTIKKHKAHYFLEKKASHLILGCWLWS